MALLTQEQLTKLRQIIQDASNALAISTFGYELPDDEIERLVKEGWIDLQTIENLTDDSYQLGVLHAEGGPTDETLAEAQRKLQTTPVQLSEIERRAMGIASSRASEYCVGLGNRWSANLGRVIVDADRQLARETRQAIREQTSTAIAERKTYHQLASDLRGLTEDWGRDWDRIAATELQAAHQEGFFEATIERYGDDEQMARVPDPGACPVCIRLLTGPDGKPIVHPMEWWLDHGSSNAGRRQNDWKPVYGPIHPHCRCSSIRVPRGMVIQLDGSLEPEETEKSQTDDFVKAEPGDKEYVPSALEGHKEFVKPKLKWRGLTIRLENEEGDIRGWFDPNAQRSGYSLMTVPYGYIENTEGEDGDEVDVFMGPMPSAKYVFVINQQKAPDFTEHDEQKCMVGFGTRALAVKAYLQHYDDPRFLGSVTPMKADEFVKKVKRTKKVDDKLIKSSSGPFIGPRGGKWADAAHTIPWKETKPGQRKQILELQDGYTGSELKSGMSLAKAEDAIQGAPVEHLGIFLDNTLQYRIKGKRSYVDVPPDVMARAKAHGNAVMTHNHPSGMTFSGEDLVLTIVNNLKEFRATTPDGDVWVLRRPGSQWGDEFGEAPGLPTSLIEAIMNVQKAAVPRAMSQMDRHIESHGGRAGDASHPSFSQELFNEYISKQRRFAFNRFLAPSGAQIEKIQGTHKTDQDNSSRRRSEQSGAVFSQATEIAKQESIKKSSSGPLRGTGYSGPGPIGRVVSGAAKVDGLKSAAKHAIDATAIMEMIEEAAKNNKRRARLVIDLHRFHKLETSLFETATPPHPRPKQFAAHLISPNDHPELEDNRRHTELAGKRAVEGQNAMRQMKWSQGMK